MLSVDYIRRRDPVLAKVIANAPLPRLALRTKPFEALVLSIISQQISWAAAVSIHKRLCSLYGGEPNALQILKTPLPKLRKCGLSPQKASYLKDLALHVTKNEVKTRSFKKLPDEEIINELTQVRGIGRWTAEMFLMFSLGRLDVFPVDDLGIKKGMKALYRLRDPITPEKMLRIAERWRPYRSVASWYIWHYKDNGIKNKKRA